jgi:hypothetical protein
MWDGFSGDRIDVRLDENNGAYIMIEPARISAVEELLRKHGIAFTLDDGTDPTKGSPEAAVIEFGQGADIDRIQRVLDAAP